MHFVLVWFRCICAIKLPNEINFFQTSEAFIFPFLCVPFKNSAFIAYYAKSWKEQRSVCYVSVKHTYIHTRHSQHSSDKKPNSEEERAIVVLYAFSSSAEYHSNKKLPTIYKLEKGTKFQILFFFSRGNISRFCTLVVLLLLQEKVFFCIAYGLGYYTRNLAVYKRPIQSVCNFWRPNCH